MCGVVYSYVARLIRGTSVVHVIIQAMNEFVSMVFMPYSTPMKTNHHPQRSTAPKVFLGLTKKPDLYSPVFERKSFLKEGLGSNDPCSRRTFESQFDQYLQNIDIPLTEFFFQNHNFIYMFFK